MATLLAPASYRRFVALGEPCGIALHDESTGQVGFRFRNDWPAWAGDEAFVLEAIAADLPAKCQEMGAGRFFAWIDGTLSGAIRVEDAQPATYASFDRTLENLFSRHVLGRRPAHRVVLKNFRMAAGPMDHIDAVGADEYIETDEGGPGYIAVRVWGHSMEPEIPDGAIALFKPYRGGTRQGQIVLIEKSGDLEGEGSWALKRYESRKRVSRQTGEWEHENITALSNNPEFDAYGLDPSARYITRAVFDRLLTD